MAGIPQGQGLGNGLLEPVAPTNGQGSGFSQGGQGGEAHHQGGEFRLVLGTQRLETLEGGAGTRRSRQAFLAPERQLGLPPLGEGLYDNLRRFPIAEDIDQEYL
ncbi:MAG: hypothetical protein HC890_18970 [Chloroflexaceae bacterium]|nr:hypothetical protein [Chloroflexaceae bacterium]